MKVCTEACILGAWYASRLTPDRVLDVGSGTGLLMLMLAQTTVAEIHGIEIETECFGQLKQNIDRSKWQDRLKVFAGDATTYSFPISYDFIISNPPFYEHDLQPESNAKQIAMHSQQLKLEDLVQVIKANLKFSGRAGILLPIKQATRFEAIANHCGLFKQAELKIKQTPDHDWFRSVSTYGFVASETIIESQLTIRDRKGAYTDEFVHLLKPYYLNLPE